MFQILRHEYMQALMVSVHNLLPWHFHLVFTLIKFLLSSYHTDLQMKISKTIILYIESKKVTPMHRRVYKFYKPSGPYLTVLMHYSLRPLDFLNSLTPKCMYITIILIYECMYIHGLTCSLGMINWSNILVTIQSENNAIHSSRSTTGIQFLGDQTL